MSALAVKRTRAALREALDSEATVTVILENGRTHTGTVTEHPTLPEGYYLVVQPTASRIGPAAFHKLDLVEVIFE